MNRRALFIFAVVAPALLMSSIDATIVSVGLPTILGELHASLPTVGWILTGYQLTQTVAMPLAGKISDDFGRKRLFLVSVVLFTVGSIGAGLSPNIYILILFRVVQGLGGGAFLPSATGIVSDAFGERRQTAIGLFTSIFPLGGIIGPNIGGVIIDLLSWRWLFFINLPIGILILIGSMIFVPDTKPETSRRGSIDGVGAGLFAGGMLGLLYALTFVANHSDRIFSPEPIGFLVAGVVLLYLFLRHEDHTSDPMIDLQLLRLRPFFATNLYNFMYGAVAFGFFSFIPFYATVGYHMSTAASGAVLTPRSLAMAGTSIVSSFMLVRLGYRLPMIVGLLVISFSLFILSRGFHDVSLLGLAIPNFVLLSVILAISGTGIGISGPASQNAALDLAPEKLAAVAGLRGMFRSTGGVLGIGTITLVLNQFQNQGAGMQYIFLFLALFQLTIIPVIFMIPEATKEARILPIDAAKVAAE